MSRSLEKQLSIIGLTNTKVEQNLLKPCKIVKTIK